MITDLTSTQYHEPEWWLTGHAKSHVTDTWKEKYADV